MSTLEKDPQEQTLGPPDAGTGGADQADQADRADRAGQAGQAGSGAAEAGVQVLTPREVPLGGLRAMTVHRTLPQRQRSLVGGWCFVDHYGPDDVADTGGMKVAPHPHTGLQTVSWLFQGEIEHRDSAGHHALVRPGELNLMTAGAGISHSEVSTPGTTTLHGVQLWVALPAAHRDAAPAFEHVLPRRVQRDGLDARVFLGSLLGVGSSAGTFSPLVGAELVLAPSADVTLDVDPAFEHGFLLDAGSARLDDTPLEHRELGYTAPGRDGVRLRAGEEGARLLLIGGEPLGEQIVMWWNFVGGDHDSVARAREEWQAQVDGVEDSRAVRSGRFGVVDHELAPIPAPGLPGIRLRPRG